MLVSWNWLKEYVPLAMPVEELAERLAMTGLNHERTTTVDSDTCVDLEVTSNRPDCLGHIGVAREASVLFDAELSLPKATPTEGTKSVSDLTKVRIDCPDLCYRYTARVIRGVKIAPSPAWMLDRLRTIFRTTKKDGTVEEYKPINNVVDITNYVLMESGQPLHAQGGREIDQTKYARLEEVVLRIGDRDEEVELLV